MYPVLYETGFANQPTATDRNDGLKLTDLYITAAVRCAPPDNKPLPTELLACSSFLDRELAGLEKVKVVVALGKIGFDAYLNYVKRLGVLGGVHPTPRKTGEAWGTPVGTRATPFSKKSYTFRHGAQYQLPNGKILLASYHPSNQNTQTGKLTREMFVEIFKQAAKLADKEVEAPLVPDRQTAPREA
jgi:uracil-DNA glycosylase